MHRNDSKAKAGPHHKTSLTSLHQIPFLFPWCQKLFANTLCSPLQGPEPEIECHMMLHALYGFTNEVFHVSTSLLCSLVVFVSACMLTTTVPMLPSICLLARLQTSQSIARFHACCSSPNSVSLAPSLCHSLSLCSCSSLIVHPVYPHISSCQGELLLPFPGSEAATLVPAQNAR